MTSLPLVVEVDPPLPVIDSLRAAGDWSSPILFDSSLVRPPLGRYSSLSTDPVDRFQIDDVAPGADPFGPLREKLRAFGTLETPDGLGCFVGGAAGYLGYELGQAFERLPRPTCDELEFPKLFAGIYDWSLVWDHVSRRQWLVSTGYPETDERRRRGRAEARAAEVLSHLRDAALRAESAAATSGERAEIRSPRHPLAALPGLESNFDREGYQRAVAAVTEYIRAGDIFQANLSQRLMYPFAGDPVELYAKLRRVNPAPFSGFLAHDDWAIASASPERFLRLDGDEVETRPIKGTRRRWHDRPEADLFRGDDLRESEKDIAENVMIVDLQRNDLSRVCRPGSIRVPRLCGLEIYETVQHLVSEVRGRLTGGRDFWDLLAATFPGGSITGAPKVRAMEIIAELEGVARGPYCGSLFYSGFDGRSDSSILIRTFAIRRGWAQCSVGGGVVVQSDPESEYAETIHKAAGMLNALREFAKRQ